jgi:flagellar biosynthesis regulator FlaF
MHTKPKNKFVSLSAAETAKFKTKVKPVFDRFVKLLDESGANGKQILAEVEALEAKYSK